MRGRDRALRISGGAQLAADTCVSGSTNAALPEMAASLLTTRRLTLHNVTRVTDTTVMAEILREIGGNSEGEGTVVLNTGAAVRSAVPDEFGRRMRATIVLLGALLARFGRARVPRPGGDDIGARRFEQHLRGLRQMGAHINETKDEIVATADRLRGDRRRSDRDLQRGTGAARAGPLPPPDQDGRAHRGHWHGAVDRRRDARARWRRAHSGGRLPRGGHLCDRGRGCRRPAADRVQPPGGPPGPAAQARTGRRARRRGGWMVSRQP